MVVNPIGGVSPIRIALAGGGTGGHLFPGLALAQELRLLGAEVVGLGPGREIEAKAREWVSVPSPRRPRTPGEVLKFPFRAGRAFFHSRRVLRVHGADALVGLGGYGSLFPSIAAAAEGLPIYLLEQNAIPGRVTRLLARWARAVYSSWGSADLYLPDGARSVPLGNPIRPEVLNWTREQALWKWGLRRDTRTLLVIGGSQGAEGLNRRVLECLRATERGERYQVIHLTGPSLRPELAQAYGVAGIRARVIPFIDAIGSVYAAADLVLARAGGTTIAEISARGLPSILVPLPHSSDDHQGANARQMVMAGAAWQVEEEELTPGKWSEIVGLLLGDQERERLGAGARGRGRIDAGRQVALDILQDLGVRPEPAEEGESKGTVGKISQRGIPMRTPTPTGRLKRPA